MPWRYSTREIAAALARIDIHLIRQRGSHMRFRGIWRGQERNVTLVAGDKTIPARTLASILKQAGLTPTELSRLVRGEDLT
ncbi:MAG: type II toxin-antitoxin system HicA family toxin [Gemmatimonadetes bacterium]|nr:type II toxin-antitoxin system HicA family toxin [Gemmatimonadota bacterium]